MFVALSKIAKVSLGFKSLQNDFFYLNEATIDSYGIEKTFLTPVLMLRNLDATSYEQKAEASLWLFNCKASKSDLRGTGALRYIEAMADRPAAEKKQTGKSLTIREVLEAQAGGTWYAPKARPNKHHLWLRKAFDGIFSPFIFETPALVDQRCNSVTPEEGINWLELAAILTSSLFAYSLEINGSANLGAGALEAPTTKLRGYPILDLTQLDDAEREKLVTLARNTWKQELPVDWSALSDDKPGKSLRELDEWVISLAGKTTKLDRLYDDIRAVCKSRIVVAADKVKKIKKKQSDSLGSIASAVVKSIIPRLQLRNFPDDFAPRESLDLSFNVDRRSLKNIEIRQLLGSHDVKLISSNGQVLHEATYPRAVAEAIVRSLLIGRSAFSASSDEKIMDKAVTDFLEWVQQIEMNINKAISESALGTGYEATLKKEIYSRLNIHPLTALSTLPENITFAST